MSEVDLTLLKRFVNELEIALKAADKARVDLSESDSSTYLVELSKATGLAASVSQEAVMLVGDIRKQILKIQNPAASSSVLEKFLGAKLKGGGPFGGEFGGGGGEAN